MLKKIFIFLVAGFTLVNICGCFVLFAGAAGSAGTAAWLSGKLTEQVNYSLESTVKASKSALKSLKLSITKETIETDVVQIMSKYSDGKTIWIDIHRITNASSKIEIRVGAVNPDKEAADKILERIQRYL
ncbi:MAG: hypothetical protein A2166_05315 [Omnitrophica WOR_2 bacterium RBG_13_41_10]|nr:MAG: hypothetical protein A2166_05315 [Omnitrophica WOR_2 bacterium RBG_13_41_10]